LDYWNALFAEALCIGGMGKWDDGELVIDYSILKNGIRWLQAALHHSECNEAICNFFFSISSHRFPLLSIASLCFQSPSIASNFKVQ
jgi:hypothetical protein